MSRFCFSLSGLLFTFFSLFVSFGAQAQTETVVERKVIVSPAPKSASCTTVAAHWEGNIWVDAQTVCRYENRAEGVAWVQDYWACIVYNSTTGDCTNWEYRPGHWVKSAP